MFSGGDVAAFLIRSSASGAEHQYQHAKDRFEACAIGQELLSCGLLVAVSSGYINEEEHHPAAHDDHDGNHAAEGGDDKSTAQSDVAQRSMGGMPVFSDMPGYIYRFPGKQATGTSVGSWTLFGGNVVIKVPEITFAEDEENVKATRDTMGFAIFSSGTINVTKADNDALAAEAGAAPASTTPTGLTSGQHVKYLVSIQHGSDQWLTWKR